MSDIFSQNNLSFNETTKCDSVQEKKRQKKQFLIKKERGWLKMERTFSMITND